ncbi:hypothetical protein B0H65DRAFT_506096 [Neurospora tetraspora]|uniref:FAD-binding PCMH-type domain-containing protein n=1 Tax=Neurospora tetraspora TaxID=94610 RepID=A0AAE0MTG5_9PEZI|nr:hypothetical protein B0H65DRAFT_506096 [Neurospora tetraspora]
MLPLIALLPIGGLAAADISPFEKADILTDCLTQSSVPWNTRGSNDWKLDAAPYNLRPNFTPVAIAVPTTVKNIQDAVVCASKIGVKANAKCGGHSYGSFGLGGEDGHLTIELDRMNKVVLDNTIGIATVEGGSRLGHVASELYSQGKWAFSHRTCPGVGVGGHVLHGGYGVSSHTHGLASDWLDSATLVLANSSVVTCSSTQNPDLFWAIRGAGGSLGIVTEFRFKTFAVPERVTFFIAQAPWKTEQQAREGMAAFQDLELNMRLFITNRFVNFEGLFYGDKSGLQGVLGPLLKVTNASLVMAQQGGWLDQVKHFGNGVSLDQGHPYSMHETFYSSSLYTHPLTPSQLSAFTSYWFTHAKSNKRDWYVQIDVHGGPTSAVTVPDVDSTAYAHRNYLFMFLFYDRVDKVVYPAEGFAAIQNFVGNVTDKIPVEEWGMYVNYPDPQMEREAAQRNYWGKHLERLRIVKGAVDPGICLVIRRGLCRLYRGK